MFVDFLIDRFSECARRNAVIAPPSRCTFGELVELYRSADERLAADGIDPGAVVGLEGDFSPAGIALLLALIDRRAIIVPGSDPSKCEREHRDEIAKVEVRCRVDSRDEVAFEHTNRLASHPLYDELRQRAHPGLVMFTSGTSGEPKAAVRDCVPLLDKFRRSRPALSTVAFLLFDHLGGLNTALHALSNAATVVSTGGDRSPEAICRAIEEHRLELLPATPTFLNLLLLSETHRHHDLTSLRIISYGAEPMQASTLERLRVTFPEVTLQQTYGSIEAGVLRSKSREDGSLWVKVGGEGYETRVIDGLLQIRARSMVMGYLNAPLRVTADGWLQTGDAVLQDGEYLKFLGRRSELISVGGEKVYPAEVESVIQSMACVEDATVYGEANRLVGQIVCAKVKPRTPMKRDVLAGMVKRHCRERLDRFKVPVKVELIDEHPIGKRFKKVR